MKRDDYKETLLNLKYFVEECDDIDEVKKHMQFLIKMNMNCMETIYDLQEQLKYIKEFLSERKLVIKKLTTKDNIAQN